MRDVLKNGRWRAQIAPSKLKLPLSLVRCAEVPDRRTRTGKPHCRRSGDRSQLRRWTDAMQSVASRGEADSAAATSLAVLGCQFHGSSVSRLRMRAVGSCSRIDRVGAQRQLPVIQEAAQCRPAIERVLQGLGERTARRGALGTTSIGYADRPSTAGSSRGGCALTGRHSVEAGPISRVFHPLRRK